jgi:WD40 repeat protein
VWDAHTGAQLRRITTGASGKWEKTSVSSGAISADGTRLAIGAQGGTVTVRDSETGGELLSFQAHPGQVRCVRFSPDGTRLATAGLDLTMRLWDARTGTQVVLFNGDKSFVDCMCFRVELLRGQVSSLLESK